MQYNSKETTNPKEKEIVSLRLEGSGVLRVEVEFFSSVFLFFFSFTSLFSSLPLLAALCLSLSVLAHAVAGHDDPRDGRVLVRRIFERARFFFLSLA